MMHPRSICLSGGGVTGLAHVGVLRYLEDKKILNTVDTYVGTSIGAVVATLHVIQCTSSEILDLLTRIDATTALTFKSCAQFFNCFGIDSGEYFMAHLIDQFMQKHVSPTVTFLQILATFGKRLIMVGTNLETHQPVYFGPETHGDMRVLDAVRISISIPLILSSVNYNGAVHVDGGLVDNFPMAWCSRDSNGLCLGSCIGSMPPRSNDNIEDFLYNVFAASLNSRHSFSRTDDRVIHIPTTDFHSFNFAASEYQKQTLYRSGFLAAKRHFKRIKKTAKHSTLNRRRRHSI